MLFSTARTTLAASRFPDRLVCASTIGGVFTLRIVIKCVTIGYVNTPRVRAPELADWLLSRGRGAATTGELRR